jgi:hypothetical protein
VVIEYNLVKYRDLCFARPENLAKIHRLVGTRLVRNCSLAPANATSSGSGKQVTIAAINNNSGSNSDKGGQTYNMEFSRIYKANIAAGLWKWGPFPLFCRFYYTRFNFPFILLY